MYDTPSYHLHVHHPLCFFTICIDGIQILLHSWCRDARASSQNSQLIVFINSTHPHSRTLVVILDTHILFPHNDSMPHHHIVWMYTMCMEPYKCITNDTLTQYVHAHEWSLHPCITYTTSPSETHPLTANPSSSPFPHNLQTYTSYIEKFVYH